MSANSKIEWTDHTWNPWWGCTRVSPGCQNCYAERLAGRFGVEWGKDAPRRRASIKTLLEPHKWNRKAAKDGVRRRVFCGSMMDWCDPEVPTMWRIDMWNAIRECTNLDWLMLTKRPERLSSRLPNRWAENQGDWRHVWLGATVENQEMADKRIPVLVRQPAAARFLSVEPMLGPVDLTAHLAANERQRLDWVIVGSESGPNRRKMRNEWAVSLVQQCTAAGVSVFVKQMEIAGKVTGDMSAFPTDLQRREFPQ